MYALKRLSARAARHFARGEEEKMALIYTPSAPRPSAPSPSAPHRGSEPAKQQLISWRPRQPVRLARPAAQPPHRVLGLAQRRELAERGEVGPCWPVDEVEASATLAPVDRKTAAALIDGTLRNGTVGRTGHRTAFGCNG